MMKSTVILSLLFSALVACSSNDPIAKQTQAVAKVNGDEITVHQINAEMQRMQSSQSNSHNASKQLLNNLIDRQLLVQEAQKLNLDRTPEIMQLVDAARAHIYAQAYLARKLTALAPATEREIQQFMSEYPEVFSHRKIFTAVDIIFANEPLKFEASQLQTLVNDAEDLKLWLTSHQVSFELVEASIPTEALPKQMAGLADQLKSGDLLFMYDDNKVVARSIANIADVPLSEQQAKTMAVKAVTERKRQHFILDEVQRLKKLAKIEVLDPNLEPDIKGPAAKAISVPVNKGQ